MSLHEAPWWLTPINGLSSYIRHLQPHWPSRGGTSCWCHSCSPFLTTSTVSFLLSEINTSGFCGRCTFEFSLHTINVAKFLMQRLLHLGPSYVWGSSFHDPWIVGMHMQWPFYATSTHISGTSWKHHYKLHSFQCRRTSWVLMQSLLNKL